MQGGWEDYVGVATLSTSEGALRATPRNRLNLTHQLGVQRPIAAQPAKVALILAAHWIVALPQQFLYFFSDPHGHGSFRPTLERLRRGAWMPPA